MKLILSVVLNLTIAVCVLASSLNYTGETNPGIKEKASVVNAVKDSLSANNIAKKYDYSKLSLIRKQNEEYVSKMQHEKKLFPTGKGIVVAYAGMHYDSQRRPLINEMIYRLKDLGVNCYSYLIDSSPREDLASLPEFCKLASKAGIEVWVVLVPPTEEPGRKGMPDTLRYPPYGLNYVKWAKRISEISKTHKNLKLFMIDDFAYNLKKFTLPYIKEIYHALKNGNRNFLFGVTYYENQIGKRKFDVSSYMPYIEAIEWGYQSNSKFETDYGISAKSLSINIRDFRKTFPDNLLIPCIYFNPNSSWERKPTENYLKDAMSIAYEEAGVALLYCTPDSDTENFRIIKNFCKEHLRR